MSVPTATASGRNGQDRDADKEHSAKAKLGAKLSLIPVTGQRC